MEDEFRDVGKNVAEWDVVKSGSGGRCVCVMIYAGADKPAY